MEAKLLNETTVLVKWKAPAVSRQHGVLQSYNVIVRCVNFHQNISKLLTNITIDAESSRITLVNLTEGVSYTINVAAVNRIGVGPYSEPAIIRLDPLTKKLDTTFTYRMPGDEEDDTLAMKPWFIILLGATIVIFALSVAMIIFIRRKQAWLKKSAFNGLSGEQQRKMKSFHLHLNEMWDDERTLLRKNIDFSYIWDVHIHKHHEYFHQLNLKVSFSLEQLLSSSSSACLPFFCGCFELTVFRKTFIWRMLMMHLHEIREKFIELKMEMKWKVFFCLLSKLVEFFTFFSAH